MKIKKGDIVKIRACGVVRTGKIVAISYYEQIDDEKDYGWQIEFIGIENGDYGQWKQWADGGNILEVNGEKIN